KGTRIKPNESLKNYKKVLREDVFNYQKEILKETGKEPIIFAYPFGDECPESNKILKEFGFKIILNSHESVNHIVRKKHSTIHLNRYSRACRYSTTEFYKRIPK
ncbi:MAG: polysaccharide deacetylase family protein, partial [Oscillospiraceae bacterium]